MKLRAIVCCLLIIMTWLAIAPAYAQDRAEVSSCPGQPKIPVTFTADCSHVKDAATRQLCGPFLENQACKVFPAYRKITGIHLEEKCLSIRYNIYEKENWPFANLMGEGGLAGKCEISLMTDYSLKVRSKIGPYDLHELLHEYQSVLGPFSTEHPFFDMTQTEAAREIGDVEGSDAYLRKVKDEVKQSGDALAQQKVPSGKECAMAQLYIEGTLYTADARIVPAFYRELGPLPAKRTLVELQVRENRMLYIVSSEKAKPFLMEHGCAPF